MESKRERMEITADILRVARGGANKTRIVYKANLNFGIVKGYLDRLMSRELLIFEKPRYYTTEKGGTYLARFEGLRQVYSINLRITPQTGSVKSSVD